MTEFTQEVLLLEARLASWVSKTTGEQRRATFVRCGHINGSPQDGHKGFRVQEYMCPAEFFATLPEGAFGKRVQATFAYRDRGKVSYRDLVSVKV